MKEIEARTLRPKPLFSLLRLGLPSKQETRLLQACLWPPEKATLAFADWVGSEADPHYARLFGAETAHRRLAALLASRSLLYDWPKLGDFRVRLDAFALHESRRASAFGKIATDVLGRLKAAGIPVIVSRGPALTALAYKAAHLRHCHDLDVLVPAKDLVHAERALERDSALILERPARLRHASGMPVNLHARLFDFPAYDRVTSGAFARCIPLRAYGVEIATLGATDLLGHIVVHSAMNRASGNLLWASDAWHLLQSGACIDWTALAGEPYAPLFLRGIEYLAGELAAPVPPESLAGIRRAAETQNLETALFALGADRALGHCTRLTIGWRAKAALARWVIAPSPTALKSAGKADGAKQVAFYYGRNALGLAARILARSRKNFSSAAVVNSRANSRNATA